MFQSSHAFSDATQLRKKVETLLTRFDCIDAHESRVATSSSERFREESAFSISYTIQAAKTLKEEKKEEYSILWEKNKSIQ